jgi:hypothetical protein
MRKRHLVSGDYVVSIISNFDEISLSRADNKVQNGDFLTGCSIKRYAGILRNR